MGKNESGCTYVPMHDSEYMALMGFDSEPCAKSDLEQIKPLEPDSARLFWAEHFRTQRKSVMELQADHGVCLLDWQDVRLWVEDFNSDKPEGVRARLKGTVDWPDHQAVYFCSGYAFIVETRWDIFLKHWMNFLMLNDDGPLLFCPDKPHVLTFTPLGAIRVAVREAPPPDRPDGGE